MGRRKLLLSLVCIASVAFVGFLAWPRPDDLASFRRYRPRIQRYDAWDRMGTRTPGPSGDLWVFDAPATPDILPLLDLELVHRRAYRKVGAAITEFSEGRPPHQFQFQFVGPHGEFVLYAKTDMAPQFLHGGERLPPLNPQGCVLWVQEPQSWATRLLYRVKNMFHLR